LQFGDTEKLPDQILNRSKKIFPILRSILLGLILIFIAVIFSRDIFSHEEEKKDAIHRIRKRGFLVALTNKNTLNYFIYRGVTMGYQFSLLESFANYLGVSLRIISDPDISKQFYYLENNAADIIALNLPVTREGKKRVHFCEPFGKTRLVLVQRKAGFYKNSGSKFITSLSDFPSDSVTVCQNEFLASLYNSFVKSTGKRAILKEVQGVSQEDLIRQVSEGKISYALCEEEIVSVSKQYFSNIDASVLIGSPYHFAWGVNHNSDSLLAIINMWLGENKTTKDIETIHHEYFHNQRIVGFFRSEYFSVVSNKLSPYDEDFQNLSTIIHWDWRLLASLAYEETNFQQGKISSRNASGLMQLMPDIAMKYGIDSLSSSFQQIAAGVKYLKHLDHLLPNEISNPIERINFVLAAYNVGIGRILLAREKATKYGRDPNKWNEGVDYYLLRRSKHEPTLKPDTTLFLPDYKMEGFVDDIINRYYNYRNLIK